VSGSERRPQEPLDWLGLQTLSKYRFEARLTAAQRDAGKKRSSQTWSAARSSTHRREGQRGRCVSQNLLRPVAARYQDPQVNHSGNGGEGSPYQARTLSRDQQSQCEAWLAGGWTSENCEQADERLGGYEGTKRRLDFAAQQGHWELEKRVREAHNLTWKRHYQLEADNLLAGIKDPGAEHHLNQEGRRWGLIEDVKRARGSNGQG